jgi:hypothetical protein
MTAMLTVWFSAALPGGGGYSFDVEQGPKAVFSRFFGTANPYEALNSA